MAEQIDIPIKVTGLADLRTQLKEARDNVVALQNAGPLVDPKQLQAATKRAGELKDRLNDANEQIKIMSGGSPFEKMSGALGTLKGQVMNLDFGGAATSLKAFNSVLMSSPLMLIATVIAGIVIAIVSLKDKFKIMEMYFNMIMAPIDFLIEKLKQLGDWLGLTTFAEDEAAAKSAEASDKRVKGYEEVSASADKEYSRQIALAKANGQDTTKLETQQLKERQNNSKKQVDEYNNQIAQKLAISKNATSKEKEELDKQVADLRKARNEQLQINKDSANGVKVIAAQVIQDDKAAQQKANEEAKANRERAAAAAIEARKRRYEVERAINASEIAALQDGLTKETEIAKERLRIQKEDLQFTKYTAEQKAALTKTYQAEYERAVEKANKTEVEKDKKAKEDLIRIQKEADAKRLKESQEYAKKVQTNEDNWYKYRFSQLATTEEKKTQAIKDEFTKRKDDLGKALLEELQGVEVASAKEFEIRVKYKKRFNQLETDQSNAIKEQNKLNADEELKLKTDNAFKMAAKIMEIGSQLNDVLGQIDEQRLQNIDNKHNKEINALEVQRNKELNVEGLSESQKKSINDKYDKLKYQADLKAWRATEEIKKKAFARDKAFRMAAVVMDTASAIMGIWRDFPKVDFGVAAAIMSAAVGALGATQLGVIAGQKYQGEAGPAAPSVGGSTGAAGSAPTTPALALYGKQSEQNTTRQGQSVEANQNITVTAVVSETEITDTQDRVGRMRANAEL